MKMRSGFIASVAIRPRPSGREGGAAATASTADRPVVRIVADPIPRPDSGKDLRHKKRCVRLTERVVLGVSVARLAGIDEHSDAYGHLAPVDQVVEHHARPDLPLGIEIHPAGWRT